MNEKDTVTPLWRKMTDKERQGKVCDCGRGPLSYVRTSPISPYDFVCERCFKEMVKHQFDDGGASPGKSTNRGLDGSGKWGYQSSGGNKGSGTDRYGGRL